MAGMAAAYLSDIDFQNTFKSISSVTPLLKKNRRQYSFFFFIRCVFKGLLSILEINLSNHLDVANVVSAELC